MYNYVCLYIDDVLNRTADIWPIFSIVIPKIKANWNFVAISMGYQLPAVNAFEKDANNNCKVACYNFLSDWLQTNNGITPKSWRTLLNRIKAADCLCTADLEEMERKITKEVMNPTNI